MSKTSSKLVFFGSGPLGLSSLKTLRVSFEIEAVVTKPSKSRHNPNPVESFALKNRINCLTPSDSNQLIDTVMNPGFSSTLGVVVDYGLIIPESVIKSFELGIVNSHFSLLPQWRGADPISFAILSGQNKTGVSIMLIEKGVDTGPLLAQKVVEITQIDTSVTLTKKLLDASNTLLPEAIVRYLAREIQPREQIKSSVVTLKYPLYSRKLSKKDSILDPAKPAAMLEREIRAFVEWPKSHLSIAGQDTIVTRARVETDIDDKHPGRIYATDDKKIVLTTSLGSLVIEELKPSGKGPMTAAAFLAGYNKNQSIET